jgi:DNA-binding NarL/FixJ family response regulator
MKRTPGGRGLNRKVRPLSVETRSTKRTAVLLDAHPLWVQALEQVLARVDVTVVGSAATPQDALDLLERHEPDLLIAELEPEDGDENAFECVRAATERFPDLRVLVLSAQDDPGRIAQSFAAGASAYVVKTAQPEDLCAAVRQSFEHSVYLVPVTPIPPPAPVALEEDTSMLTRRELEILQLVGEGHSNAQVGRMLWVTEQTVKFHLSNIYRKLDVSNRTEASRWAQVRNLLPAPVENDASALSAAH